MNKSTFDSGQCRETRVPIPEFLLSHVSAAARDTLGTNGSRATQSGTVGHARCGAHSSQPRVNTPASALCYPPRAGHRTVVLDSGVFHAEGQRAVRSVQAHTPHKQSTSAQSEGGVHGPLLACKAPGSRCPRHKLLITGAWAAERPQIVIDLACRRRQPGTPASAHAA